MSQGLVVQDLSRRFGPRWVLVRVSVNVSPGEGLLLLGHNGSGKTTLLRCLATALRPHDGAATWDGTPLWDGRDAVRPQIAFLSHASRLYDDLSARQNLSAWASMGRLDPSGIDAALARVGLAGTGDRPSGAFSAGMKRRLALAMVLLKRPRLVLLDEPFTSLDVEGRALVHEIVDELRQGGATLVLSTHLAAEGARHCQQAIRLEAGKIVWRGAATDAVEGA